MQYLRSFASGAIVLVLAGPAAAADFSDPDWPCIQRKVEQLSPGLMWPHPLDEVESSENQAEAVQDLATTLSLRRVSDENAKAAIDEFSAAHGAGLSLLGAVFAETFERIDRHRSKIMVGIADYSHKQIALAERIDDKRAEFDELLAAESPDYDRIDQLEKELDWDERIYNERADSLTYVCETPVLLEKRLYRISQMLRDVAE